MSGATTYTTNWDSQVATNIALGGNFTFGAVTYTSCNIFANGYITFGGTTSNSAPLSSGTYSGAISAFGQDGASSTASGATPSISYMNVGGATGEFVVQFADHANYSNRSTERLNFQIRLNLATNAINIVYGSWTAPGSTNAAAQIGIRGNSTTWNTNVNNLYLSDVPTGTSCSWNDMVTANTNSATVNFSSSNTNIVPSNGLTFTWAPPAVAIAPVRAFGAVTGITQTTATFSWTAASGATQYNVQYRIPGTCSWTSFSGNPVTTNSVTLTGLTLATNYQVRVQATDGTNNAIWSHIPDAAGSGDGYTTNGTFKTTCATTPISITEGFNSASLPACWATAIVTVQTASKLSFVASSTAPTASPYEGANFVKYSSNASTGGSTGSEERLISLPLSSIGTSSVDVQFAWFNENSTSYNSGAYLNEGVMVQYSLNGTTWTDVQFFARYDATLASGTGQWKIKKLTLPAAAGNAANLYVAFKFHSEWGNNCYMDKVNVLPTPPPCVAPTTQATNLIFGGVTNAAINGTYTAATSTPDGYVVIRTTGAAPTNPVNGTTYAAGAAALGGTVVAVGNSTVFASSTGLTGNTGYSYYIFSYTDNLNCNGGPMYNVTSPLTGTVITCPAKPTAVASGTITSSSFNLTWTAPAGGTAAPITYSVEISSNSGFTAPIAGSPFLVSAPTTSLAVTGLNAVTPYYYRITAHNGCNIGATTAASATTSAIPTDLQTVQLQAPAVSATSCYGSSIPVVIQIKNVGSSVLDFSTNNATIITAITGTNPQSFTTTVSTGTLAAGATQNVTVTSTYNMNATGNYTVNATSTLATPDANPSNDAMTAAVRTTAAPTPLPYFEDFSAGTTTPTGWTNSSSWSFAANHGVTNNGMYKNLFSSTTTASISTMKLGTLTGAESITFDFRVLNYSSTYPGTQVPPTGNWGNLKIQVSADCGTTYTDIGTIDNTNHTVTTQAWTSKSYPLASYAGQNITIRFVGTWVAGDFFLDIDNINLASCFPPTAFTNTNTSSNSTGISWTAPTAGTPSNYVWEVRTSGAAGSGATGLVTSGTVAVPTTSASAGGLTPTTSYTAYVRSDCGSGNFSTWTSKAFATPAACPPPISLTLTTITPTTAVATWTAGGTETNWFVKYTAPTATAVASGTPSYTMTGLTPSTNYSVQVKAICGVGDSSAWTAVNAFATPCQPANITSTIPGSRCGVGTMTLGATGDPGATLKWYTAPTGGTAVATGSVYTTPSISASTNYYVSATGGLSTYSVGSPSTTGAQGTNTSGAYLIFDALTNMTLNSVNIYPGGSGAGTVVIALQNSTGTTLQTATVAATGASSAVAQLATLNFTVAPGTGYRLVYLSSTGGVTSMYRESSGTTYPFTVPGVVSITGASLAGGYYYYFYNWQVSVGCESARTAVAANVTTPPTLAITSATAVCANAISTVSVTSATSNYDSYIWSPVTNLYTDAGATTPYTGGSASVLYYKSATSGSTAYTLSANNSSTGCANLTSTSLTTSIPVITTVASPSVVCSGAAVTLSATANAVNTGTATFGSGATTSAASPSSPFNGAYGGMKAQYILRASDLIAAGISAGNITSLGINITSAGSTLTDFAISMGTTTLTAFGASSDIQTGVSQVYSTASFVPVVGNNIFTFSTPFNWNGTSNIIVSTCWSNGNTSNTSSTVKANVMPYTSAQSWLRDSQTSAFVCALTGTISTGGGSTSTTMPQFIIGGQIMSQSASTFSWQWNPGALTGNTVTVNPVNSSTSTPTTATYTVTGTESGTGCTGTAVVTVSVNPVPSVPVATNATQCGYGVSTASVSGGTSYKWYATPTSTTVLQSGASATYTTAINATTTWYVASSNATCESARAAVTTTVTQPDAVTATATSTAICPGNSFTLSATSTGTNGSVYSYTWTASPATGSGIATSVSGATTAVTPTTPGNYVYMVTAVDGVCTTTAAVNVTASPAPVINASLTPTAVCSGAAVTLSATTNANTAGNKTVGTNSLSDYTGGPYREGAGSDNKVQYLFTAAELTAAGMAPGNITALSFSVTSIGTGTMGNFTIRMGSTASTSLAATYITAPTSVVYGPSSYVPVAGVNAYTFSTPFNWNGTDNVIVQVCHDAVSGGSSTSIARQSIANRTAYTNASAACTSTTGTTVSYRAMTTFSGQVAGQGAGTYTWQWNPGALNGNTVTVNPVNSSTSTPTTVTYTVTGTDPLTTCSNTAAVTVTVNPIPSVPVATNATQCGYAVSTASVSGGTNYKWYATATSTTVLQSGSSATYTTAIGSTTTWYVSSYNATCESARTTVTATVTQPDAVTAAATTTAICPGQSFTLSATKTGTNNTYSYTWTATPAAGSGIATSVAGTTTAVTPSAPGTYAYMVTAVDGVCTATASVNVKTNAVPAIAASASPSVICAGSTATLTGVDLTIPPATVAVGAGASTTSGQYASPYYHLWGGHKSQYLYLASDLTAAGLTAGNLTALSFSVVSTGTSYAGFAISLALTNTTNLAGGQVLTGLNSVYSSASATPVVGLNTYSFAAPFYWDGTSNLIVQTCWSNNNSGGLSAEVKYDATAYVSNNVFRGDSYTPSAVCSNTATSLTYSARPQIRFTGGASTTSSLTWQWNPGAVNSNTMTVTPPTGTSSYTLTANDPATTCSNTAVVTLTVNPIPSVTVAASTGSICSGTTASLTATGATTYSWMPAGGTSSVAAVSPTTSTIYTVTGTSLGCSNTQTVNLNVTPTPTVTASASPTVICAGATVSLTASGATTYSWMPNSSTSGTTTATPTVSTTYTVSGTTAGCTNTRTLNVTVNNVPTLTVTANPASGVLCTTGATATLTAAGTSTAYVWGHGPTTASTSVAPSATTVYSVTGTNSCGVKTVTTSITVATTPTITATPVSTLICVNNPAVLNASATAGVTYSWSTGSSATSVTVTPNQTTTYTVTATNACGTATATVVQNVSPCVGIEEIANAGDISIYPNPANDYVSISVPATVASANTKLEVTDALGKLVIEETISREVTTLRLTGLKDGVYFFKVITNNQPVKVGKVVKH